MPLKGWPISDMRIPLGEDGRIRVGSVPSEAAIPEPYHSLLRIWRETRRRIESTLKELNCSIENRNGIDVGGTFRGNGATASSILIDNTTGHLDAHGHA